MLPSRKASLTVLAALMLLSACRRQLTGYPYPTGNELYFPLGVQLSGDGRLSYVVSTNWDQRYNSGWISVLDNSRIIELNRTGGAGAEGYPAISELNPDPNLPEGDPARLPVILQQLYVPSLGGQLTMTPDARHLIATFRNRAQVIVFEIGDDGLLSCGDPNDKRGLNASDRLTDCDRFHIYQFTQTGPDYGLIQDQFVDPFSVNVVKSTPDGGYTVAIGFLKAFQSGFNNRNNNNRTPENSGALVSFLDLTPQCDAADPACVPHSLLGNQRSINLSTLTGTQMLASTVVATYPVTQYGNYVTIAARGLATTSLSTTTLINVNIDNFDFYADNTEDTNDDINNLANLNVFDLRSDAGGFNVMDITYTDNGRRAFLALGYSQPASGISDSVVMLDASLRTDTVVLSNDERVQVTRPVFRTLDTLAVLGTPQSLQYIERAGRPSLIATATITDNALHFVRVGDVTLDRLTRVDRQSGLAPVVVRHARFAIDGDATEHDYVFVPSFLDHGFNFFDITNADPAQWTQGFIRSSSLPNGDRFN